MQYIWANGEGVTSHDAHIHLITRVDESIHRSRTSVIFFLDDMVEDGFLVKGLTIGKGGTHGIWKPSPDFPCEEAYIREMAMRMVKAAG